MMEVLKYIGDFETMTQLQGWVIPTFPVGGKMLMVGSNLLFSIELKEYNLKIKTFKCVPHRKHL